MNIDDIIKDIDEENKKLEELVQFLNDTSINKIDSIL